jgi:hypothetical protein
MNNNIKDKKKIRQQQESKTMEKPKKKSPLLKILQELCKKFKNLIITLKK